MMVCLSAMSVGPVQVVAAILFLGMILGLLWLLPGGWRIARAIAALLVFFLRFAWKAICVACRLLAAAARGLKRLFGRIFEAVGGAVSARRAAHRRRRESREARRAKKNEGESFSLSA